MARSIPQIVAAAVVLCLASLATAHPGARKNRHDQQIKSVILELEKQGRDATLKNDVEANDRLLADNWMNVNPDGSVTTKAQLMELLKAGTFKISSIENDEVKIRTYANAAIVTGLATTKRAAQGGEIISRQVRFTRVYVRTHGRWQVASAHNTLVHQP